MKNLNTARIFFFFIIYLSILNPSSALDISVNKASFQYKSKKYVEVYLQVLGNTTTFTKLQNGKQQASVNITLILKRDSSIYNFEKFNLTSPESDLPKDFISLRRLKIENGKYQLIIEAKDNGDSTNVFNSAFDFEVDLNENLCISDIQMLAKIEKSTDLTNPFVKNSFYLEPTLFSYLPKNIDTLGLYSEIYNSQSLAKGSKLNISINTGFRNDNGKKLISKELLITPSELSPILTKFDIKALPSGNYHLKFEIFDEFGISRLTKTLNFQRSNPLTDKADKNSNIYENSFVHRLDKDSLFYFIKAMVPIVVGDNSAAINEIVVNKKTAEAKYFIWKYWSQNPDPEASFREYMKYARAVDQTYRSQIGYGFETDRGYIYLKYGMPKDVITVESEPTAPPYEIWFYDIIKQGNQRNIKFIFYIPSLAHNDFELLHSNCRGELNNPNWFYELYSKRSDSNFRNVQPTQIKEFYNSLQNSFDNNAVKIWEQLK